MAVVGLTIGIGADTKKFNQSIKKMDKSVRQTNQEVYNLSKSLEMEFDSGKFVRAQKLAQESLKQTETKAQALRDRLQYLDEVGMDKSSEEYKKLQRELTKTELHAQRLGEKLKEIKGIKIEELAKKFEKVGEGITKAGQAMVPFSAAAAAVIAGFAKIGLGAVSFGDDIGTTAQQINISTKELQKWQYIAQQTDVPISQMVNGLKKIQVGLGALAAGEVTDPIAMALSALGVSAEQASKGMGANFEDIIGKLAEMEDATMQAYYANEIFGAKMGANIIPMLNDGGAGLAALSAEFETMNYLTDEEVQSLDAFEDVMDRVKYILMTVSNQIGVALLPTFEALADVVEHRVAPTLQKFADFMSSLSQKQIRMGASILVFITAIAPLLLIVGKLTSGIGGVIRMAGKLSGALSILSAHPIMLTIGILVGLMALLYNSNEEFKASIDGLVQTLSALLMPILKIIGSLFTDILTGIMPLITILLDLLAPALTLVVNIISFLVGLLAKALIPALEFVGKVFGAVFESIPKIIQSVVDSVEWMINAVIGLINGLIDKVNKIGKYIGITLDKFDDIELEVNLKVKEPDISDMGIDGQLTVEEQEMLTAQGAVMADVAGAGIVISGATTTIDNSKKEINIEITIENYAAELDVDDMVKKINAKLVEAY